MKIPEFIPDGVCEITFRFLQVLGMGVSSLDEDIKETFMPEQFIPLFKDNADKDHALERATFLTKSAIRTFAPICLDHLKGKVQAEQLRNFDGNPTEAVDLLYKIQLDAKQTPLSGLYRVSKNLSEAKKKVWNDTNPNDLRIWGSKAREFIVRRNHEKNWFEYGIAQNTSKTVSAFVHWTLTLSPTKETMSLASETLWEALKIGKRDIILTATNEERKAWVLHSAKYETQQLLEAWQKIHNSKLVANLFSQEMG